jgi:nucleoside-diphosphate-sugar epimerase
MKVLLTGASSFTGYWFACALRAAGHEVVAPLLRGRRDYDTGVRSLRVRLLEEQARIIENCPFGGDRFLDLVGQEEFTVLCHHAAQVGDYRARDYDVGAAFAANTHRMPEVLARLSQLGLTGVVLTGTFSEQREAVGTEPRRAFNAYSLAKGLTADAVAYWCDAAGLSYGKFTLPNPFGPLEEARFCAYLVGRWKAGQVAEVRTPAYVRDNMHVDLLALSYVDFVAAVGQRRGAVLRRNPSGYIESQGSFTARFAAAMRQRSKLACDFDLVVQTSFPEPMVRVNMEPAAPHFPAWDERVAWDKIAAFYDMIAEG